MNVINCQQVESLVNEAVKKHKEGNIEEAISLYLESLESDEKQLDWVYGNVITLLAQAGKEDKGLSIGHQSLNIHPNSDDIHRAIGLASNKKGDYKNTIQYYLKSLEINQNQPDWLYSSLVSHLVGSNKLQQAIEIGQLGINLHSNSAWIYYHLGEAYAVSTRWLEALSCYTKAAEIQSDLPNIKGKINLAVMNVADRSYKNIALDISEETATYNRTIKLNPQQPPWFYLKLVDCLFAQNQLDSAIKVIQRAIETYPEQIKLFHSHYDGVITSKNDDVDFVLDLVTALEDHHELGQAAAVCQKGLELYPENKQLVLCKQKLSQLLSNKSTLAQSNSIAETDNRPSITSLPGWKTYHDKADELQAQGKLEDAVLNYHQSIIRNPQYSWSYHNLADTLLKQGKSEEAIIFYKRALELYPDYFWSYYNLGVAYNNSGKWSEAIALYRRSIKYNPSSYLPYQGLKDSLLQQWNDMFTHGDMFLKQGQKEKASEAFCKAIKLFQDHSYIPQLENAREIPSNPSVILIVDDHLSQCMHYRVEQKIEQLEYAGISVEYFPWSDVKQAKNRLHFHDVVIFYRVPALPDLIETIEYAKAINKVVFYEIDDLIFKAQEYPDPIESYGGQVSEEQYQGLLRGTTLFYKAMSLCDYGIASTPALAREMKRVVAKKTCFIHRNALDKLNSEFAELNTPKIQKDYLSIFYGSGTKAHNADFEQLAAPAIAKILQQYPHVRLILMGYLTLPEVLIPYQEQIIRVDLVKDVSIYWEFLRQADINIAVLLPTAVNNCKSELKWFEAGCLGVPSVVSNTQTYTEIISDGVDALIASTPEEWYAKLDLLVSNAEFRQKIAQAAYERAWQEYSIPVMADNIKNIVLSGIEQETIAGNLKPRTAKKKLLIVNVFYPPQSIGGATRIVKDNVDILKAHYGDEYEISVFTTDNGNPHPYEILEYSYEGIHVTKVSSPMVVGMDWQYQNPKMYEIFTEYLQYNQPDLVHFHCVQRLTGSVLEATSELNIPYLVTVHDAWWISDHQFLVNDRGIECNYQQNDPIVAACDSNDVGSSLKRKRYLKQLLAKASGVLAVSEAFTELYRLNGITKTQANRNGIIPQPRLPRTPSVSGKVRIAHIGGMAAHKGYFLFKEAVEKAQLSNCEVIVVSHAQVAGSINHDSWGSTPVTFISKIPQTKMYEFYSTIDVLMAPSMWPESFGLVTREAAAAGVWVVASNKGALAEDLVAGVNGDIFDPDNIEDLIAILRSIDSEPRKHQQLIDHDLPIRTTEQQVKELQQTYQSLLD
ncbi:tetratricopeptide repeat protein [Pleurocapsales cyanobacterium LEGE 10410]|nr:tetratricopeptide repeat protein [Pleurocapsales cyanobacterium LEGE 10410]